MSLSGDWAPVEKRYSKPIASRPDTPKCLKIQHHARIRPAASG